MLAFMAINLLLLGHNITRYIIPLRVISWLILPFYVLATLMMIARIGELSYIGSSTDDCVNIADDGSIG